MTQFELMPQPPEQENKPLDLAVLADQAAHLVVATRKAASASWPIATKDFDGQERQGRQA